jgi:hypothetical protein
LSEPCGGLVGCNTRFTKNRNFQNGGWVLGVDILPGVRYIFLVSLGLVFEAFKMNSFDFWNVIINAQVSTALVVIAVSLAFIAMKLYERAPLKSSK